MFFFFYIDTALVIFKVTSSTQTDVIPVTLPHLHSLQKSHQGLLLSPHFLPQGC